MIKTKYILTEANTANLAELLLEKLESMLLMLIGLVASVCTLSNPPNEATLYKEKDVAKMMQISLTSLQIIRKEGKIHHLLICGTVRYRMCDFWSTRSVVKCNIYLRLYRKCES